MTEIDRSTAAPDVHTLVTVSSAIDFLPAPVGGELSGMLIRMFRDPRILGPSERRDLIAQLRHVVALYPHVVEVRVLLGMALCVDLQAQEALEHLRQATRQAPDCFIARLKFGELLMRLRVCDQAAEETQRAAELATNTMQSEMARKQAASIRTMMREGIERGGYKGLAARLLPFRKKIHTGTLAVPATLQVGENAR